MPVIVRREDWDEWFSPGELEDRSFQRITAPYAPEEISALEVSPLVNSARVDDSRCCDPAGAVPASCSFTEDHVYAVMEVLGVRHERHGPHLPGKLRARIDPDGHESCGRVLNIMLAIGVTCIRINILK
jgi:hypothetical protein